MSRHHQPPASFKRFLLVAPEISHLQAFILFQLAAGEKKGKALRQSLKQEGISQEIPTFHACVGRLIRDGFISSKPVKATAGARGTETAYSLTPRGRSALRELRRFYRRLERLAGE